MKNVCISVKKVTYYTIYGFSDKHAVRDYMKKKTEERSPWVSRGWYRTHRHPVDVFPWIA